MMDDPTPFMNESYEEPADIRVEVRVSHPEMDEDRVIIIEGPDGLVLSAVSAEAEAVGEGAEEIILTGTNPTLILGQNIMALSAMSNLLNSMMDEGFAGMLSQVFAKNHPDAASYLQLCLAAYVYASFGVNLDEIIEKLEESGVEDVVGGEESGPH